MLNKYLEILDRIKKLIEKDFDVELICKNNYIIAKIYSCNNEIKTNFHDKGLPLEQIPYLTYFLNTN